MTASLHDRLLDKYYVPSLGDHAAAGGPVMAILDRLDATAQLSAEDLQSLRDKGLFDPCQFVERLEETERGVHLPVDRV